LLNDAARAGARPETRRLCVAYRQLFAVTFAALGLVTVGCGSGSAGAVATDAEEQQPPANQDQPPTNGDQAPINRDQPPRTSGGLPGGGGSAVGACQAFCSSVAGLDCKGGGVNQAARLVCGTGCKIPAEDVACEGQIAAAIGCLQGVVGLCTDALDPKADKSCEAEFQAIDACEEQHQPPDEGQENAATCTKARGCDCATPCEVCVCQAADLAAQAACLTGACAP
jgi:hypothetical protein